MKILEKKQLLSRYVGKLCYRASEPPFLIEIISDISRGGAFIKMSFVFYYMYTRNYYWCICKSLLCKISLTCPIECESLCPRFQTMHVAAKYSMNLHARYLCMEFYRIVDVTRRENWEKTFFERSLSCPAQNLHLPQIFRISSHSATRYFLFRILVF